MYFHHKHLNLYILYNRISLFDAKSNIITSGYSVDGDVMCEQAPTILPCAVNEKRDVLKIIDGLVDGANRLLYKRKG